VSPASTLFLETEIASGYRAGHFGIEWTKQKDLYGFYLLDANSTVGGSQSKSTDSSSGETTVYRTQDLDAGLGFGFQDMFELHISGFNTKTPETKFSQSGTMVELSFRSDPASSQESAKELDSETEKFTPSFSVGLGSGNARIKQTLEFTVFNRLIERDIEFDQKEFRGFISFIPVDWLKLKISGSSFAYSESKEDLQTAFNNFFLNYYMTDLVSTISGLPESSVSLQGVFKINTEFDLEIKGSSTKLIVDDSISRRGRILITKYFEQWTLAAGFSRSETNQSKEFAGLFNVSYQF
jgi:hypothetical protein